MITLTLLHPLQNIPVQTWVFDQEPVIRIGRATDNHVILYSAVVSRHHVELRRHGSDWEIVSLGTNGTYLDGKRITQAPAVDGVIIRLARSGPNLQIRMGTEASKDLPKTLQGERTLAQQPRTRIEDGEPTASGNQSKTFSSGTIPVPPHLRLEPSEVEAGSQIKSGSPLSILESVPALRVRPLEALPSLAIAPCKTHSTHAEHSFCLDCGQPLQVQQIIGDYQVLQTLGHSEMSVTYLAWRQGQSLVLKTLNPTWAKHPYAIELLTQEAELLQQLQHPSVPQLLDLFAIAGQPYLAMEMIYGQTLTERITSSGPVSLGQAIAWLIELCEILDYFHTATPPQVHCNLHPDHLMKRSLPIETYAIAVLGLGGSKMLAVEPDKIMGMPGYMAPEQQTGTATPATDVYALGPLLIYLLTGEDPSLFYGHREQGFRLYAEYVPNLPPEVVPIIRTLTHPDPEDRYSNTREVAHALASLAA